MEARISWSNHAENDGAGHWWTPLPFTQEVAAAPSSAASAMSRQWSAAEKGACKPQRQTSVHGERYRRTNKTRHLQSRKDWSKQKQDAVLKPSCTSERCQPEPTHLSTLISDILPAPH